LESIPLRAAFTVTLRLRRIHYSMEAEFEDDTEKKILEGTNALNSNMSVLSEEVIDARRDSML
jgi:hypothetical protein